MHRFPGHERDMVIFDTVDAAPLRPGVLLSGELHAAAVPAVVKRGKSG